MTARTRAPKTLTAALAVGIGVLVACSGDGGRATTDVGGGAAGQDASATGASGDEQAPEDLAVAAYQESWDATFRALNPAEETPELRELLTGEALAERLTAIGSRARDGHRVEGSMETHPIVVSASESEVVLDDCAVENSVEYDARAAVVDSADGVAFNYRVTVVNEGGTWKVSDFERREEPCTPEEG